MTQATIRDGKARATLVATLASPRDVAELESLPAGIDCLEWRADLLGDSPIEDLRSRFSGVWLYTLRSVAEGGRGEEAGEARTRRIRAASRGFDLVDLEGERDLIPELLAAVAAERRIISWHGERSEHALDLVRRAETYRAAGARLVKLVVRGSSGSGGSRGEASTRHLETAPDLVEPLLALASLRATGRHDVLAFTGGEAGAWTRLVAARLGAPWIYLAAGTEPAAPGQPGAARWIEDFGLPELRPVEALFGVVGRPVDRSLSPRLHNLAYRELELPFVYLPFHVEAFGDFWLEIVESGLLGELGMPLRGLSVTAPYKESAVAVAGAASPLSDRLSSANTLILREGTWEADTTDAEGVVAALSRRGHTLAGASVAVLGAGGAGKVAAAGLALAGARVTLFNRTEERGRIAAEAARVGFGRWEQFAARDFSIIVHVTPLGRAVEDPIPFDISGLRPGTAVLDMVYGTEPTSLLRRVTEIGGAAIDGRVVLFEQARGQFRRMTGQELSESIGTRALGIEVAP